MPSHKWIYLLLPLVCIIGCWIPSGGGTAILDRCKVCYGIDGSGIKFILYTDLPGDSKAGTGSSSGIASSEMCGFVQSSNGKRVDYAGTSESLTIAGTTYELSRGRVFLAAVSDEGVSVQQLDISIKPTGLSTKAAKQEIQRIATEPDVAAFFDAEASVDD
jgi:hypothetical protein